MSKSNEDYKVAVKGQRASKQGKILEQTIIPAFEARGFQYLLYSKWKKNPSSYSNELLLGNVPYTTIYGHRGYTEFLVKSEQYNLKHRIECKWQQSSGSVDEKLPYLYLNCIQAIPEEDIIIVAGGGGMKKGAVLWLKEAVQQNLYVNDKQCAKNIDVFSLEEFLVWANQLFGS